MTTDNSCNGNWLFQISMKVTSMSFLLKHRKGIWSGLYFGSRGRKKRLEYGSLKMLSRYGVILERDERCSVTITCLSIPSEIPMQALSLKIAFVLAKYGRKRIASCYINLSSCCCRATGGREYISASSKSFRLFHWPWSIFKPWRREWLWWWRCCEGTWLLSVIQEKGMLSHFNPGKVKKKKCEKRKTIQIVLDTCWSWRGLWQAFKVVTNTNCMKVHSKIQSDTYFLL